jgi:hypothetical protein
LRGALRSAANQPSIVAFHGPNTGAARATGVVRRGGTGDDNAAPTSRRCTPNRRASSRIDSSSRACALRTCS